MTLHRVLNRRCMQTLFLSSNRKWRLASTEIRVRTLTTTPTVAATAASTDDEKDGVLLRHDHTNTGVTYLTLNRPKQYNAMNEEVLTALQENLDDIATQPNTIRVVVIAANGPAFCSGHDLKEMMRAQPQNNKDKNVEDDDDENDPQTQYKTLFRKCSQMMMAIHKLPQPVIAQVQGLATAAGCQLVATCDLAVAATETARFATSGINVGLFCATPAVALCRNIAQKQALGMLLTGDFINAETALDYGLVNQVVPLSQLDEAVQGLATQLVTKSPDAIRMGKEMFYQQLEMKSIEDAYEYASDVMACNMMSTDTQQGIDAFLHKRPPPVLWKP